MPSPLRLPRQAWAAVAWRTAKHMLVAVIASVVLCYIILETFSQGIGDIGLVAAIVAPLVLGGPMVFYMTLKQFELQLAYEKLEEAAARDSLTGCLNHGAFANAVTALLLDPQTDEGNTNTGGTLLMVDADHFKSINDRFGHASGDTALRLIAAAIRNAVYPKDIVGRLGGEEFGVFLPGAGNARAQQTAEAIRNAVEAITFETGQEACMLSVSIGGAVSSDPAPFGDLFRLADQHLYKVKEAGRNNVSLVAMPLRAEPAPAPQPMPDLVYRGQKVMRSF